MAEQENSKPEYKREPVRTEEDYELVFISTRYPDGRHMIAHRREYKASELLEGA